MKANQSFRLSEVAVSPVIGVILMVAVTVVLASVVFVIALQIDSDADQLTPNIVFAFSDSDGTARLVRADIPGDSNAQLWSNFASSGCDQNGTLTTAFATAEVRAGQEFTGCTGEFSLLHLPTNVEVANHKFP